MAQEYKNKKKKNWLTKVQVGKYRVCVGWMLVSVGEKLVSSHNESI